MELETVDKPGDLQVEGKFSVREMCQDIQTASTDMTSIFFWLSWFSWFSKLILGGVFLNLYVISKLYLLFFLPKLTGLSKHTLLYLSSDIYILCRPSLEHLTSTSISTHHF